MIEAGIGFLFVLVLGGFLILRQRGWFQPSPAGVPTSGPAQTTANPTPKKTGVIVSVLILLAIVLGVWYFWPQIKNGGDQLLQQTTSVTCPNGPVYMEEGMSVRIYPHCTYTFNQNAFPLNENGQREPYVSLMGNYPGKVAFTFMGTPKSVSRDDQWLAFYQPQAYAFDDAGVTFVEVRFNAVQPPKTERVVGLDPKLTR